MTDDHPQTGTGWPEHRPGGQPTDAAPAARQPSGSTPSGSTPSGSTPSGSTPSGFQPADPDGLEPGSGPGERGAGRDFVPDQAKRGQNGPESEQDRPEFEQDRPESGRDEPGPGPGGDGPRGPARGVPVDRDDPDADPARRPRPAPEGRRRRKLSAAGAVIALLLGLLGFAFVVQLRSNSTDEQLSSDRPEDLVRILSDLDARKDRLSQEISAQQTLAQQLAAGSQSRQAAQAEASRRADELGILSGTLAAQGPGLRVEFRAASKSIVASDVLDAVEELRGAGAEAMQIAGDDGTAVRIIASTSFVDGTGGALAVDGRSLSAPYTITVIGEPQTMQIALNIPDGVVDTVHHDGGNVSVVQPGTVQVTALHQNTPPRYAQPVG